MKFEFSEENYQWCGQCGGNVRKDVDWCRYCHKKIGSRFLRDERIVHPSNIIDGAAHWLPDFGNTIARTSAYLQERIRRADSALARDLGEEEGKFFAEKQKKRTVNACSEFPPSVQAAGLVWDIMLSLRANLVDVVALCEDKRLPLIGITPESLAREAEARLEETHGGNRCKYCFEFIAASAPQCRYCESDGQSPPKKVEQVIVFRRLDPDLLAEVILFEAAKAKAKSDPPLPTEVLERHSITPEIIEAEVQKRLKREQKIPMSVWRAKQKQLGVKTERPLADAAMEDLLSLASGCSWENRNQEAQIVYQHATYRLDDCDNATLFKTRILTGLASIALSQNDVESYNKYNNEANALRKTEMPAILRKPAEDETAPLSSSSTSNKVEEHLKRMKERQAPAAAEQAPPQLTKVMAQLNNKMNSMMGNTIELAKLKLDADTARDTGDLDRSVTLIETGLSRLRNNVTDVIKQVELLGMLAHVQKLQGNLDGAEATHKHAISIGEELAELGDGQEHPVIEHANYRYGCFLVDCERFAEAETHLDLALKGSREHDERLPDSLRSKGPWISEMEANIKKELARLYRKTDRHTEADEAEAEAIQIHQKLMEQKKTTGTLRKFSGATPE
jgi:tetratricopeptide (TPR) repeat protein